MSDGKSRFRTSPLIIAMTLMVLLVSVMPSASAYSPSWNSLPSSLPEGKSQAVVVADNENNTVYLFGGLRDVSQAADSAFKYDVITGSTTRIAKMNTGVRGSCGALGGDGRIYIFSGWNSTDNIATTQIYDIKTESWTTETDIPNKVYNGECVVVWPMFYIMGGTGASTQVQIYNASDNSWYVGPAMDHARTAGAAVYNEAENAIYYCAGVDGGGFGVNDTFRLDIGSGVWSDKKSLPASGLAAFDAAIGVDGIIYAVGGSDGDDLFSSVVYSAGYYYCPNNNTWHSLPGMTNSREYLSVVSLENGRILAIGGNDDVSIFNYFESLTVVSTTTSLSKSSIGQGSSAMLSLAFQSFASQKATGLTYYIKMDSGTAYAAQVLNFIVPGPPSTIVDIAQLMPAGQSELHVFWTLMFDTGTYTLSEEVIHFEILATVPLQDQINELNTTIINRLNAQSNQISDLKHLNDEQQNDINDLLAQLNQTNSDLDDAINQLNNKAQNAQNAADSAGTYAMIALALGVILIIVFSINILMAKKR